MDIKEMISVLSSHNIYIIFIIMFLESLNLTGIPSTIILPAIGILISLNNLSIIKILLLTIFNILLLSNQGTELSKNLWTILSLVICKLTMAQ